MKKSFGFILLASLFLGLVMHCATTKPQQTAPKMEVIIIHDGIKNYYYCEKFEESKKDSYGHVIYRFLDKNGSLIAKVTVLPNTKVLINDRSQYEHPDQ